MLATVLAHAQNRDIQRAAAIAEQALAEGFEHPLLLNVLATRLEEQGKLDDAVRLLERAVSLAPEDVPARNALALCLQRSDRPAESLYHAETLLKSHPELAYAHANKGNALIALGLLQQAQASHLRALQLDPGNLAAMGSLASIATHHGKHGQARRWAEQLLSRVPGFPDAVLSLAAAELADGSTWGAEKLLRELLADRRAGATDRARAHGLLGDVLDAAGRYDEAFEQYSACNQALRQIHRGSGEGTSLLEYTRALTEALAQVAPRWPRHAGPAAQPAPGDPAQHVLLMGFPRSGTTLLEVLLDGHPQVVSLEEHELLTEGVMRFMREPLDLTPLASAEESELRALRDAYWERVRLAGVQIAGKIFVDKYPMNTLKLPLIARLFPRARNPAMYQMLTLGGAARLYDAVMDFAERARPLLGLEWHEVRYERLMADLAAEMRAVCSFLGLEWSPAMQDFAARAQATQRATPSTAQLARGLDPSGVGHWRHYQAPLEWVQPVLERWIKRLERDG